MRERLYRSRDQRMVLGVAGGLAEWFDLDPSIVRIAFVLVTLAGGAGLLIYIAMALIVPERPAGAPVRPGVASAADASTDAGAAAHPRRRDDGRGALIFGVILIVAGAWFLVRQAIPALDIDRWWPVLLIGIGVVLLVGAARGKGGV